LTNRKKQQKLYFLTQKTLSKAKFSCFLCFVLVRKIGKGKGKGGKGKGGKGKGKGSLDLIPHTKFNL
jgi:hypothetical protein